MGEITDRHFSHPEVFFDFPEDPEDDACFAPDSGRPSSRSHTPCDEDGELTKKALRNMLEWEAYAYVVGEVFQDLGGGPIDPVRWPWPRHVINDLLARGDLPCDAALRKIALEQVREGGPNSGAGDKVNV